MQDHFSCKASERCGYKGLLLAEAFDVPCPLRDCTRIRGRCSLQNTSTKVPQSQNLPGSVALPGLLGFASVKMSSPMGVAGARNRIRGKLSPLPLTFPPAGTYLLLEYSAGQVRIWL